MHPVLLGMFVGISIAAPVGPIGMLCIRRTLSQGRLHGIVTRKYLDQIAFPNLKKGFDKSGRPASQWENFQIGGGGFLIQVRPNRVHDLLPVQLVFGFEGKQFQQEFGLRARPFPNAARRGSSRQPTRF